MIAILLSGILACACAAPSPGWRQRHNSAPSPFDGSLERFLNEQIFDTNRFWEEMTRDLNREMMQMETMLSNFSRHFPSMVATERVEGNEYKIVIPLTGFVEQDISVKARRGLLMIQAVHDVEGGNHNSYLDVRNLPACVGEQGTWSYENGVLRITFQVLNSGDSGTERSPGAVTPLPAVSREETESPIVDNGTIVDIDLDRGDSDQTKAKELQTNEIPNVEATTYAVDLNGDVEFVPVQYRNVVY